MRKKLTYVCLTSLLFFATGWAQQSAVVKAKDTLRKNNSYGLQFSLIVSTVVVLFYFIDPSTLNTIVESITKNIK